MIVYRVGDLPESALEAAARFHSDHLPAIRAALTGADAVTIVFAPAPLDHRGWRLAVVQDLARATAPARVNALSGDDEQGLAQAVAYFERAPGITGQFLAVDGKSGQTR